MDVEAFRLILEVIATTLSDAVAAAEGGADRIELVTGMAEGGLTPSYGTIGQVARAVNMPVQVMVRPHSQSFRYNAEDVRTMLGDIRAIRHISEINKERQALDYARLGIVIGCLTRDAKVDAVVLEELLGEAGELDVTFHRAFDEAADLELAYATLSQYPAIRRVLTSGGKPSALDAVGQIRRLVELAKDSHVRILPGSGLTLEALPEFMRNTGAREVHFGSAVRTGEGMVGAVDPAKVQALKQSLAGVSRD